ncbi:hypothetical protein CP488_01553 [Chthonomonas calidirosea]|nr:hypothetical protein CP488_01553 [Chthonomonas calidirosea]
MAHSCAGRGTSPVQTSAGEARLRPTLLHLRTGPPRKAGICRACIEPFNATACGSALFRGRPSSLPSEPLSGLACKAVPTSYSTSVRTCHARK